LSHRQIVSFIWVADLIRGSLKRQKCQDVILPLTVPLRFDSVLAIKKKALACARRGSC